VLREGRVHRFEGLKVSRARILEFGSGDLSEVSVTEVRGVPSLPISELDQRLDRLRTIDTVDWSTAQQREAIIGHAINGDGPTTALVDGTAMALGLSARTSAPFHREVVNRGVLLQAAASAAGCVEIGSEGMIWPVPSVPQSARLK
jgi:hypothetical protein